MRCTTGCSRFLIPWALAACVALGWSLATGRVAQADMIYTENFGTSPSKASLASVGWGAWNGSTAVDCGTTAGEPMYIYFAAGGSDGPYFTAGASGSPIGIATTTEPGTIDTSLLESIVFRPRNKLAVSKLRVAVKVEGDWYASNDEFGTANAAAWGPTTTFTWTNAASEWLDLDFTPGSTLSLGSGAGADLSGSVTEFGFYVDSDVANADYIMRVDNFTINATAVPEPGNAVLIIAGLVPLLARVGSRRRRNAS